MITIRNIFWQPSNIKNRFCNILCLHLSYLVTLTEKNIMLPLPSVVKVLGLIFGICVGDPPFFLLNSAKIASNGFLKIYTALLKRALELFPSVFKFCKHCTGGLSVS